MVNIKKIINWNNVYDLSWEEWNIDLIINSWYIVSNNKWNAYPNFDTLLIKPNKQLIYSSSMPVDYQIWSTKINMWYENLVSPYHIWYWITSSVWTRAYFTTSQVWWNASSISTLSWWQECIIWWFEIEEWKIIWETCQAEIYEYIIQWWWSWSSSWTIWYTATYEIQPWLLHTNWSVTYLTNPITKQSTRSAAYWDFWSVDESLWIQTQKNTWITAQSWDILIIKIKVSVVWSWSWYTVNNRKFWLNFWYAAAIASKDQPHPISISIR